MNDLERLTDEELTGMISAGIAEQRRRAKAGGDVDAIVEAAFETGFDTRGTANPPWVDHGMLICPGSIRARSRTSHNCVFVNVDGDWVWQIEDRIIDVVRTVGDVRRANQRSITLLAAIEGLEYDVVASNMRQGTHRATGVRSYRITEGKPALVTQRNVKTGLPPR